jgi:hypothetical protein
VEAVAPFSIIALTVTVPGAVAVNVRPLIDAPVAPASLTVQVIVLLVASTGDTVPVRVRGVPAVAVAGTPVILLTAIKARFIPVSHPAIKNPNTSAMQSIPTKTLCFAILNPLGFGNP